MAKIKKKKKSDNLQAWRGCRATGTLIPGPLERPLGQPLWKSLAVSFETNHVLTICPSNHTFKYLPKGNVNVYQSQNLYTNVLIALFTMIKN